jgi:putative spermidine/putrescine transport system ATP-binding protein
MSHLVLNGLSRAYAGRPAVRDLSLSVERGALVALLGASGCGKTTTLRMIAGLETPDAGQIVVDGRDVTALAPHRRRMGVVFQSYALFPHMDAAANVAFGMEMHGVDRAARARRATQMLELVGLGEHARKKPRQMSGGQQQRVALARALAIEPDVLLLDEPLSALDAKLREDLRVEMRAIQRRAGATTVFVTHDQAEALAMADLVAVMNQGRIAQLGSPEAIFERPESAFVAEFVGRSARFAGNVAGGAVDLPIGPVRAVGLPQHGKVEIFVRPHRIRVLQAGEEAENIAAGTLGAIDYTGEVAQLMIDSAAGRFPVDVATADGAWRSLALGDEMRLGWRAADTLWFPSA